MDLSSISVSNKTSTFLERTQSTGSDSPTASHGHASIVQPRISSQYQHLLQCSSARSVLLSLLDRYDMSTDQSPEQPRGGTTDAPNARPLSGEAGVAGQDREWDTDSGLGTLTYAYVQSHKCPSHGIRLISQH